MDDNVQRSRSTNFIGRLRFSVRSLLLCLMVCSVLFALLAFHLGRLQRQAAAADYFRKNNSTPIAGSVEFDSFTFEGSTTTEGSVAPGSGSVSILLPVVTPQKNNVLVETLIGEWSVRRERIVQIGVGVDLDGATLKTNIAQMPWLKQIMLECKMKPSFIGDGDAKNFECSLSDIQIEQLREEFPDLKLTKTGWINP